MGIAVIHHNDVESNCTNDVYWSIFNINHTGQECCGVGVYDGLEILPVQRHKGIVRGLRISENYKGYVGLGNVNKIIHRTPITYDPIKLGRKLDKFLLTWDGYIVNRNELREKFRGVKTSYDNELAARIISEGKDFLDGIDILANVIKGPYCLGIITQEGETYAARCPMAMRPLMIGEGKSGFGAITESRAFRKISMKPDRDLEPGEIITLDFSGFQTARYVDGRTGRKRKICSFLYGYYSWVDSVIEGIPVNLPRERVGAIQAIKDREAGLKIDAVVGIADSGKAYAEGYAKKYKTQVIEFQNNYLQKLRENLIAFKNGEKDISTVDESLLLLERLENNLDYCEFTEGELKYPYFIRSYDRPEGEREIEAEQKHSTVDSRIEGKIIVVYEDSIRTGNVLLSGGGPLRFIKAAKPKSVHLRMGSPRNKYCCILDKIPQGGDSSLLANRLKTDAEMAQVLGVDSVGFIEEDEYIGAITEGTDLTRDDFCLGCHNGDFSFLK